MSKAINKKYQLTQFTEFFGGDEVKRNYAHAVDDKFLKCKTERQYIKWFYFQKPIADELTKSKDLWLLQNKYVRFDGTQKISKAMYKILRDLDVA